MTPGATGPSTATGPRPSRLQVEVHHVLDDFTWRRARWGWPVFALLVLLADVAALPRAFQDALWTLWLGWCAAWLTLAGVRAARGEHLTLPVVAVAVIAAEVLAAMAAMAAAAWLDGPGMQGLWRNAWLVHWASGAAAAAVTAVVLGFQFSADARLQRQRQASAEREHLMRMERELLSSQLKVLQAQIEPHFLYNSLANVQQLVRRDGVAADRMLGHLIDYLRAAVPSMRGGTSSLGRELQLARAFLGIMGFRMGDRLAWSVEAPDELTNVPVPPTVIGTLLENAIKHGLEPLAEGGRIDVIARREDDRLVVEVADTGRGVDLTREDGGVGLANARERLFLIHGDRAELDLSPNEPRGVIARMKLPLPKEPDR